MALSPAWPQITDALTHPQRTADTAGPDALVLATAALLAWASWGWGAVGLALTAASALPGVLGGAAQTALRVVLPAGARRGAAVVLGLGLGVAGPLAATVLPVVAVASAAVPDWPVVTAEGEPPASVPDWPSDAVPDWPPAPPAGAHVVVRGDCLWSIAADHLLHQLGREPTDTEVSTAVRSWWVANAAVIGPDPDLVLPGQVLRPPT
jgi:nucleoid-associated protein YgaU